MGIESDLLLMDPRVSRAARLTGNWRGACQNQSKCGEKMKDYFLKTM